MKKFYRLSGVVFLLAIIAVGCGSSTDNSIPVLEAGDIVNFTLIQTTDVHHRVLGEGPSATYGTPDDQTEGGYMRLATKIGQIRGKNGSNLLVDSGDFLMGTVFDLTLGGSPAATTFMNEIGYDAITIGNHELDYGPGPCAKFLENAKGKYKDLFSVPVVASNMVTSDLSADDDGIEDHFKSGTMVKSIVKTLPNGLKVGIVGVLGKDAQNDAPLAAPLTFQNVFTGNTTADAIALQALVDDLKENQGADIVIALSHSGITDPNGVTPGGDDIAMAAAVTGIDIIAAGHEHEMTNAAYQTPGGTYIVCAGSYGKNIAQLDVTVEIGTGVTAATQINHAINSSVPISSHFAYIFDMITGGINDALSAFGLTGFNDILAVVMEDDVTDNNYLAKPSGADESGMGNLVADSLRFMNYGVLEDTATTTIGIVANGVIRGGFKDNQQISFADMYSILPLGMTLDESQQNIPGYPLMKVYLTGTELTNLATIISYVIAAGDETFKAGLLNKISTFNITPEASGLIAYKLNLGDPVDMATYNADVFPNYENGDPAYTAVTVFNYVMTLPGATTSQACAAASEIYKVPALYATLNELDSEYFMNISGIQINHGGIAKNYAVQSVKVYHTDDLTCTGAGISAVVADTKYPVIIDLYALLVMNSDLMQDALTALSLDISPENASGNDLDFTDPTSDDYFLNSRMDQDPDAEGIQEVKEWMALHTYLTKFPGFKIDGVDQQTITAVSYGTAVISNGDSSRVNSE